MRGTTARYALSLGAAAIILLAALAVGPAVLSASAPVMLAGAVASVAAALAIGLLGTHLVRQERRHHALTDEVARLEALVAAAPDAFCGWSATGTPVASEAAAGLLGLRRINAPEDIEGALAADDATALGGAIAQLRRTGEGFRRRVATADGGCTLQIRGRRGKSPCGRETIDVLWLSDATAEAGRAAAEVRARETAEEALSRLQAALDGLPLPIWLRRPDLSIFWCNRAYARATDATPEQVRLEQRELAGGAPRLAERAQARGSAQSEVRPIVVAGARRMLELTEAPVPTSDSLVGYAFDQTELTEARSELARHVAAHAAVLEELSSAVAVFGPDTRLKFFNRAYARLWHLEEAWMETEPLYGEILEELRVRRRLPELADFVHFKKERLAQFNSLLEPGEDLMHLPDGTTLRRLTIPHPFGGLMFIMEDVTSALALESSYNTLMAVQQETLDNLAEGIAVFGGDGRLKLSNPAYARIWHLDPEDIAQEPHVSAVIERIRGFFDYGDDWDGFREDMIGNTLERSMRSGRIERTDGSVVEFANVPLPDGAVLNSYLDVTDSVRVEQALRATNEALEVADRLKSEFIANVSYQLRTPLNAIMGFAEILTNQYFGELNARQMEYGGSIIEAGRRLLALINDILDVASIEAGYMELERAPIDVAAMLAGIAALTRELVRHQDLRLEIDCPADIGTFEADEKRLRQILFNLVSNAVKFTPAGGRISLAAERQGDWIALTVTDTGIGIPEADRPRVFGRFERANLQTGQAGAGLGLPLVKSFVELHGGHVEMESSVNLGTQVRCVLPAQRRQAMAPSAA